MCRCLAAVQGYKLYHNVLTAAQQQMLENLPGSVQDQRLGPSFGSVSNLEPSNPADRNQLGNDADWLGRNLPANEVIALVSCGDQCTSWVCSSISGSKDRYTSQNFQTPYPTSDQCNPHSDAV